MSESAVCLERVGVALGGTHVLSDVSAAVPAGELVGIIGPNGAGKTTLLHLLNGLRRPTAGRVQVLGQTVNGLRGAALARLRQRIGYVPQVTATPGTAPIRAREVVEIGRAGKRGLGRRLTAGDHRTAGQCMERLGIAPLAERLYRDLSGGEQRKVHLARALAQEPDLLLLDEPTSNLDPRWQEELTRTVERLWSASGLTVCVVTHETHLLPVSTRRVWLLARGRFVADGRPEEVLTPERLAPAFGVPVQVIERAGRRYVLAGAAADEEP